MRLDGLGLASSVACVIALSAAQAAAEPQLETNVSSPHVEVGQPFEIELKAVVTEGDAPSKPVLTPPAGLSIEGPSVGTRREMSFVNGSFETRKGITATWTLAAQRPGSYVIGPPQVSWGGSRYDGQVVRVEVVPRGTLPRQRAGRRGRPDPFDFDPFDLLNRRRLPPIDDDLDPDNLLGHQATPEEFAVEAAPDATAFLRATVTPTSAVVGEQVTLRIYAYGSRGAFEELNTSEASRPKFLSHVIVENSYRQPHYAVDVGGSTFNAVKVREVGLFPLEAGTLEIGPMRMGFRGRGYPATAAHRGLVRHSQPLTVTVSEPPLAGRPAGYRLGDVGQFKLAASVQPRQVKQNEAISVTVTIDGWGYPPTEVRLPEQRDVEWLTPEVNEQIRTRGSQVGGTRKLSYVVRLTRGGNIDLGEVTLPYFDAQARRYETARVALGTVSVDSGDAVPAPAPVVSAAPTESPRVRLTDLANPRKQLGQEAPPERWYADALAFWLMLLAGPIGVVVATGAARSVRRVVERRRAHGESLASRAKEALAAAKDASARNDAIRAAADVERAVYHAIEDATGLRARGVLRERLEKVLSDKQLAAELARAVVALLDECEAARFAGSSAQRALLERAEDVVRRLLCARVGEP